MGRKFSRGVGVHLSLLVALLAVMTAWPGAAAAQKDQPSVKEQLAFGVDMARRGLWSEALFRFRQAERLAPEKPEVYNNLAVAHEALGLFEEALELYRKGLSMAPRDKGLRNNYARFIDFYNRFRPDAESAEEDNAAAELDPAQTPAPQTPAPQTSATEAGPPPATLGLVNARNMQSLGLGWSMYTSTQHKPGQSGRSALSRVSAGQTVSLILSRTGGVWKQSR